MRSFVYSRLTDAVKGRWGRTSRSLPTARYEKNSYKPSINKACEALSLAVAARRSPAPPCHGPDFALLGKMQRLQGPASFAAGLSCANHEKSAHVLPSGI